MAKGKNSKPNSNSGKGSSKKSGSYVGLGESKTPKVNGTTRGVNTGGRPKK
ncbi:hypothetical protein [Winogradskyella marincola]|uniref:Ribosomal small subunit protein bTHX n=1 Tax=Winogradskyella marincola TaxID=3037795 RepID=A0ABT6G056_9FLAO|nr:hypothetical protein [Winogradskyella sp. YYF002]MDG4715398.1 hypothetical protein [Winogradskyella sp. YYF002]